MYVPASNRATLGYPGGPTLTYTHDPLNRLTQLTDLNGQNVTLGYDALSRRTGLTLPNGVGSSYGYDAANRLTTLTHVKSPTTLASFTYGYDALGNRTSLIDSQGSHTLTYDPLSQLTQATTPTITWAYDAVGNRTTAAGQSYTPTALNQYSQVAGITHTWDGDGNLTNDGQATYTFDAESRLTQVVKGATTVTCTYDALGRRARKTVNGTTRKYLYDGADLLVETNASGTITARDLFGPWIDEPLERKVGTTTRYYVADGLGSVARLTTSTGTLAESYTYDPFGTPTIRNGAGTVIATSAFGNRFLFTGREWDSEIGLAFYRARYYKPGIGRFLSRDPLSYLPDVNLYRYVNNNPLTSVDPFGYTSLVVGGGSTCFDCGRLGGPPQWVLPPGDRPSGILAPWPPGDRTPPPIRFPPVDISDPIPSPAPGDRGPTKGKGSLPGMAQPPGQEQQEKARNRDRKKDAEKKPHKGTQRAKDFIDRLVRELGLNREQRRRLHDAITRQGYTEGEIRAIAEGIKYGRY